MKVPNKTILVLVLCSILLLSWTPAVIGIQIRIIFCNYNQGCGTDDGYLVNCGAYNSTSGVAIMRTIEDGESYIILQRINLPQGSLEFSLDPDDSPVQSAIPTTAPSPAVVDPNTVPLQVLQRPRCFRIPPGLFRKGRYFPFAEGIIPRARPMRTNRKLKQCLRKAIRRCHKNN